MTHRHTLHLMIKGGYKSACGRRNMQIVVGVLTFAEFMAEKKIGVPVCSKCESSAAFKFMAKQTGGIAPASSEN